jgi:NitT/TauT family transport system ATP-binding protein/sulfonate transport system ATP-binding protein
MARGPRLKIDIVEKRFAAAADPVLANISIEVEPGRIVAVLGRSGIGKSTLLRLVAGIDRAFSGSITLDGVGVSEAPPAGFVFQDPRLLPWLTAVNNVRAGNVHMSHQRALELLAQVGLGANALDYPHQLSGGMQRRVALARALAASSGLLLLDEPFVSLDRALASEMRELLAQIIAASGATVLIVTHEPQDAVILADRVIVLTGHPASFSSDLVLDAPRGRRDAAILIDYASKLELAALMDRSGVKS